MFDVFDFVSELVDELFAESSLLFESFEQAVSVRHMPRAQAAAIARV
ncbi:hypothetical protein [Bifidobacterium jacchi]|nr:hypothetical protein [Bifidobacterium jacchi]